MDVYFQQAQDRFCFGCASHTILLSLETRTIYMQLHINNYRGQQCTGLGNTDALVQYAQYAMEMCHFE